MLVHTLGDLGDEASDARQHLAGGAALEHRRPEGHLERIEAPQHRRLIDPQGAGRSQRRTGARDG